MFSYCVLVAVSGSGEAPSGAYYKPTLSGHNSDSSEVKWRLCVVVFSSVEGSSECFPGGGTGGHDVRHWLLPLLRPHRLAGQVCSEGGS